MDLAVELIAIENDYCIIYKPAGLSFHAGSDSEGLLPKVRECLLRYTGKATDVWPVHRLDQMTSGLVIFALSAQAASLLGEMFAQGTIQKRYLALSSHPPSKKQGWIKGGMVKGRNGCWRLTRAEGSQASLFAVTYFESKGGIHPDYAGLRLFDVKPRTGRTHQIRVALKSLGSPIVGDERYGGELADRGYLHAAELIFRWDGKEVRYQCLPKEGKLFIDELIVKQMTDCIN